MQTSFIGALQTVSVSQMPKSCAVLLRKVAMLSWVSGFLQE